MSQLFYPKIKTVCLERRSDWLVPQIWCPRPRNDYVGASLVVLLVLGLIVGICFGSFAPLACDVDFLGGVLKGMTLLGEGLAAYTLL